MFVLTPIRCDRLAPVVIRCLQPLSTSALTLDRSHYDALGITPKATQADVKAAYYRLTKQYHPDTAAADGSTDKFRQVTAAYEVLGNVKLRRLYDRGMHHSHDVSATTTRRRADHHVDDDPQVRFYRSRQAPSPLQTHGVPVYDFDAWSRGHYGRTLEHEQLQRRRQRQRAVRDEHFHHARRSERILIIMLCTLVAVLCMSQTLTSQHDQPLYKRRNAVEENNVNCK